MYLWKQPSHDRDWSPAQAVLPWADLDGDRVVLHSVRHCTYRGVHDYDVRHEDRAYELSRLRSVDLVVEPFAVWRGPAHTFVSFGFDGHQYVAVSPEIRKVRGQAFSALKGLFKAYELMYVVGDERDLVGVRALHRRDDVYVYPLRASREGARRLFLDMLRRLNQLRARPEFYHTLTNNCVSNLVRHINKVVRRQIPFSFRLVLPGYCDRLAYDLGWIDTRLPFGEARRRFLVNERAAAGPADAPDFSVRIRTP
jgi:hypothetical protein